MTNILHNLTGKFDGPTVTVFKEIDRIARRLGIPFFVVGATARDIIFEHIHDIKPRRATVDIDIGVFLADWDQFQNLKEGLIKAANFNQDRQTHRLISRNGIPVDIVPFGKISEGKDSISWPPDHETKMSTTGFLECYQNAIAIKICADPDVIIKVASLAGLAILKIISWNDAPDRRGKDAVDLLFIVRKYAEADNEKRFIAEGIDILSAENNDYESATARFLGRDMVKIANPATKARLVEILKRESLSPQGHGISADALRGEMYDDSTYERAVDLFNALLRGLTDPSM